MPLLLLDEILKKLGQHVEVLLAVGVLDVSRKIRLRVVLLRYLCDMSVIQLFGELAQLVLLFL